MSLHGRIRTYTGREIDPWSPMPADINIADIAHGLAYQARWGGQGDFRERWYSIAEHSVLVAREVAYHRPGQPRSVLAALLHDAPEAYILDVPRPLKRILPEYEEIEHKWAVAISAALDVDIVHMSDVTKRFDDQILHNEANAFMNAAQKANPDWGMGSNPIRDLDIRAGMIPPRQAEIQFLNFYYAVRAQIL